MCGDKSVLLTHIMQKYRYRSNCKKKLGINVPRVFNLKGKKKKKKKKKEEKKGEGSEKERRDEGKKDGKKEKIM
ncbi:hypothetical protein POVWA2_027380 [Plasmodium ovale wallikeri]|uniref:Uncharacterized protein n=1 Tax=Plasmodium ovale wallikeri TaxID=864142 RepID=A0A1A8YV37_PLAOA|nr:hypothetical protein POVWA1_027220 [Plasmodium ovale wallikeri]SBT35916.1 hypothetical protein POVWA2_027380 [Plasmodium ovale wallikeri]